MRLEKFGETIVARSCVSAVKPKGLVHSAWDSAHLVYEGQSGKKGLWHGDTNNLLDWVVEFDHMKCSLYPSEMGQVGIFPEQQENWRWLSKKVRDNDKHFDFKRRFNILNAFAYTGASTIACCVSPNVQVRELVSNDVVLQLNTFLLYLIYLIT